MYEKIKEKLTAKGLKVTMQRVAVYEALINSKEHPSADSIIEGVSKKYPGISTGTIYKTLETLVEKDLVKKIKNDGDKMRYDAFTENHHHIYLENSDQIMDYYDEDLNKLLENYFKEKKIPHVQVENISLEIVGKYI
jgi:Fur family peroxide stress response transcriptional regulator